MSSSLNPDDDHKEPSERSNIFDSLPFRNSFLQLAIASYVVFGVLALVYFSLGSTQFRAIFVLHEDVTFALNMTVNILVYAFPAFFAGLIGSLTRILLSSNDNIFNHFRILIGSGFIAIFTFLGLKSGLVYELIVGSVSDVKVLSDIDEKKAFYKLIMLCILTGMFATTIFLTIEERVTNLANKIKNS